MAKAKYITGEAKTDFGTIATAICFGEVMAHSDFSKMFKEIWGAGFFYIDQTGAVTAYGKSVSLGVESRPEEDAKMIEKALVLNSEY